MTEGELVYLKNEFELLNDKYCPEFTSDQTKNQQLENIGDVLLNVLAQLEFNNKLMLKLLEDKIK